MATDAIRMLLSDVDGTLVTQDKVLTDRAIDAVKELEVAGVLFALTSGRPPRGMSMLVDPLEITTPIAAFNGGLFTEPDMSVIEQRVLPEFVVSPAIELLSSRRVSVWVYRGADWFVLDRDGPHVAREAWTVQFAPSPVGSFDAVMDNVAKIVGVTDDPRLAAEVTAEVRHRFGDHVSAAQSQPYYIDITHPDANKGRVLAYLSDRYGIPPQQIATIGDMPNDVLMFARSGLSIAMGNATREVQRAARRVTASNDDEGFATAVERYVLPAT